MYTATDSSFRKSPATSQLRSTRNLQATVERNPASLALSWGNLNLGDVACVVIPSLAFWQMRIVGNLFATDVALLSILPLAVARHPNWLGTRSVSRFLGLCLIWLLAQVATDLIVGSSPVDYLRGWFKIALTMTHFAAIALLIRDSVRRTVCFGVGLAFGDILTYFFDPSDLAGSYPWKFGLGIPITTLCVLGAAVVAQRHRITAVAVMLAMAVLNLLMGFRSYGGICLVTAVFVHFQLSPSLSSRRLGKLRVPLIFAGLVLGMWGLFRIYSIGAPSGWFGEAVKWKYSVQSGGSGGLLIGGRSDLLGAWAAIADSPIIGHGSWAKDPQYASLVHEELGERGFANAQFGATFDSDLIPSHSHLFGAWVESGIIGALFWCWVLSLPVLALVHTTGRETLLAFFVFTAFTVIWHILFSPYAGYMRVITTYFVYTTIVFGRNSRALSRKYVQH